MSQATRQTARHDRRSFTPEDAFTARPFPDATSGLLIRDDDSRIVFSRPKKPFGENPQSQEVLRHRLARMVQRGVAGSAGELADLDRFASEKNNLYAVVERGVGGSEVVATLGRIVGVEPPAEGHDVPTLVLEGPDGQQGVWQDRAELVIAFPRP